MSLRIQSSVDLAKLDTAKATWIGTTNAVTGAGEQKEIEPVREFTKDALKESPKSNGPFAKQEELDRETVEKAVDGINGAIEHINRGLRFSVHEDTQRLMVKVVDVLTDEVIKELPPEDVLDTAARIKEAIGLLIDERA